ncbi:MAG: ThiF family adenylyltransferase, partial [Desulfuromonas sp.]
MSSASSVSASELDQLLIARHGASAVQRFKSASVGLAGAGGLGSAIAAALARLGIGTLIVADFDRVEAVNLGRQQYFIDQIGLPKVEALRANLQRIHPGVRIIAQPLRVSAANLLELFGTVDILVEAFDDPVAKADLT